MLDLFTLSFSPDLSIASEAEQLTLQSKDDRLILEHPQPGLRTALEQLKQGNLTLAQLTELVSEQDGVEAGITFASELEKLVDLGWICHSVLPLITAIPIAKDYELNVPDSSWQTTAIALSRFAFLHQDLQQLVLESPRSKSKLVILDWRVGAVIAKLAQSDRGFIFATSADSLLADLSLELEELKRLFALLIATQMMDLEPEDETITQWKFHNLLFHHYTRLGRLDNSRKLNLPVFEHRDRYPYVKPVISTQAIPLVKPDLTALATTDMTLTEAIETRRSIREYSDQPITLAQLGEFLYRCARVKAVYTLPEDPMQVGESTTRPYPSGGALYELEIYPLVHQCGDLAAGLYHYQPLSHTLHPVADWTPEVESLVYDAWRATGQQSIPQIVLIITARFGRLFWKYHDIAYSLILKHVGVLYQTFYLVATAMQLAPSAIGAGNTTKFCQIAGLNPDEEASVGEFSLGAAKPQQQS
uniref:SagB-type dehydrogenase domain protein n=3 Tax=Cyanothece sp. (strain PCC 7425 / ATCC 29141) TaxID=395961 RepID=B8HTZ1_CYAP4|nr:Chain B, CyaGox [Cyanothece sp. PCC 7425]